MARKYRTKINLNKRKKKLSRSRSYARKNKRNYLSFGKKSNNPIMKFFRARKAKVQKIGSILLGVLFILLFTGFVSFMVYLKDVTEDLPSPDQPFGAKAESSVILADNSRSGGDGEPEELYSLFDKQNRQFIDIEEIPVHVQMAFVAAEDDDFYRHSGVDFGGIFKAGLSYVFDVGGPRGGSTITQQLIKNTTGDDAYSVDRKVREILSALAVEREHEKDQILEMYMNTINFGSNVYGIQSAADFYFDKEVKDLTIAESAILARIPNVPSLNSPIVNPDKEDGRRRAFEGRDYVLGQMRENIDKINTEIDRKYGEDASDYYITEDEINAAFEEEIVFGNGSIDIEAPHFVFFVQDQLTTKPYNDGKPFNLEDLRTGGYRIYTTLDKNIQSIAEEEVANGVETYASPYGGRNGAMVITDPNNGDIIAMVGSKDYNAPDEGKLFNGKVNVPNTPQQMGSSMKPFAYGMAFEDGLLAPGSFLPDIPIEIGNYEPLNYNRSFNGVGSGATARRQLVTSRNTSAVMVLDAIGVNSYIDRLLSYGYESLEQGRDRFGLSLVLGAGEVTMVEHAQGYGVLANGGYRVDIDPINKITKFDPDSGEEELIYEKETNKVAVADSRAVYMVNHVLNYKYNGPPKPSANWDGRDYSGKTGTTEEARDTIFAGYTPDYVQICWNGNNDNTPMRAGADGGNVTEPWCMAAAERMAPYFPDKTTFSRPGGIISGNSCEQSDIGEEEEEDVSCASDGQDFLIDAKIPPAYKYTKTFMVCEDQPNRLARDIDKELGFAEEKEINVYRALTENIQNDLDRFTSDKIPTEFCNKDRNPNGEKPFAQFSTPSDGAEIQDSLEVNIKTYTENGYVTKLELYLGDNLLDSTTEDLDNYQSTFDISTYDPGNYPLRARVFDSTGEIGESSINIALNGGSNTTSENITISGDDSNVNVEYTGGADIANIRVYIREVGGSFEDDGVVSSSSGTYSWSAPNNGTYEIYAIANTTGGVSIRSETIEVIIE